MKQIIRYLANYRFKPWLEKELRNTLLTKRRNNTTGVGLLVYGLGLLWFINQVQVPSIVHSLALSGISVILQVQFMALFGAYDRTSLSSLRHYH